MLKATTAALALALLLTITSAVSAFELGFAVATYHESGNTTPLLSVGFNPYSCEGKRAEYTTTYLNWSRDGDINHTNLIYTLPVYEIDRGIKFYVDAGAGMKWDEFDDWDAELAYGLSACGPVLGVITRASWTHLSTAGNQEDDDLFAVGVYFGRDVDSYASVK